MLRCLGMPWAASKFHKGPSSSTVTCRLGSEVLLQKAVSPISLLCGAKTYTYESKVAYCVNV